MWRRKPNSESFATPNVSVAGSFPFLSQVKAHRARMSKRPFKSGCDDNAFDHVRRDTGQPKEKNPSRGPRIKNKKAKAG
jgi:hypothetical protein